MHILLHRHIDAAKAQLSHDQTDEAHNKKVCYLGLKALHIANTALLYTLMLEMSRFHISEITRVDVQRRLEYTIKMTYNYNRSESSEF